MLTAPPSAAPMSASSLNTGQSYLQVYLADHLSALTPKSENSPCLQEQLQYRKNQSYCGEVWEDGSAHRSGIFPSLPNT